MKSIRERTEIQQAFLDGADIEVNYGGCADGWKPYTDGDNDFDWMHDDFRIKPKPMERWVNIYDSQEDVEDYLYLSEEDAENDLCADGRTVHFIEVIK